jgi:hypothetical protein
MTIEGGTQVIERIQVEEGFLDHLDLIFAPGLNVLIGPRGAGKTSVIELIRFCLDVHAHSEDSESAARQHALSILGPGQVTVTVRVNDEAIQIARTAQDEFPRKSGDFRSPLILSQNQIESLGLHAAGKLQIIDGFRQRRTVNEARERTLISAISSLTVEAASFRRELDSIEEQIRGLSSVPDALAAAEKQVKIVLENVSQTNALQTQLKSLDTKIAIVSVKASVFERAGRTLNEWGTGIRNLIKSPPVLERWPDAAGPDDQLKNIRARLQRAVSQIQDGLATVDNLIAEVQRLNQERTQERLSVEQEARQLRRQLEQLKSGAGAITRQVADLKEKTGQLSALQALQAQKLVQLQEVRNQRDSLLDQLDQIRVQRFQERTVVAETLNAELGPRIAVSIERSGLYNEYISTISAALRGSGLHYGTLAPQLATVMSPRELCEAIETRNAEVIADLAELTIERAARIIGEISKQGTERILTCNIDDSVTLSLLDGAEYKPTERLSTGQRCTVILPILLGHHREVLIVDQPEDHLDNAFVADTLVQALLNRRGKAQLIFSTHNANIPVLGEANRVILLGSDGKRGFVRHAGALDDPTSVDAIATLMEGGREAFRRRARFYGDKSPKRNG